MGGYILENLTTPVQNGFSIAISTKHRSKDIQFKEDQDAMNSLVGSLTYKPSITYMSVLD